MISDLEGRLSLLKRQVKTVMDQAGKSFGLMKRVSLLEDLVSDLMAKIINLEECDLLESLNRRASNCSVSFL
jgi:hypothetical protein